MEDEDENKIQQARDELFKKIADDPVQTSEDLEAFIAVKIAKMKEQGLIEFVDTSDIVSEFHKDVLKKTNLMTTQEAGRATYKSATPNKDGMKLIIDEAKLAQIAKDGFGEMEQG